jgi:hypothetical protein
MGEKPTPEDVLKSTTPQVKKLVAEILKFEKEYQHHQNLSAAGKENELCDRIIHLIEREIRQ